MKLHFPHGEHKDVILKAGIYRIGSSKDAEITIDSTGLAEVHATLVFDGKEIKISIDNAGRLASVNGKLVKDSREVRQGDLVILSQVHVKIIGEAESEKADVNKTRIRMALPKFILRGVSGAYFGKTYPLRGGTVLGRHSECDICVSADGISRKHAEITVEADGLRIKDLGSSNGTSVNGKQINSEVSLKVGDEVKLDNIRFLVQTPGLGDPSPAKQSKQAHKQKQHEEAIELQSSGGGAIKWLITVLVLGGAVVAAWQMGYLDRFL
ncbi:MAG: FHA domain-containing protein [Proteobacteria bacterium]|nr:FHA domain-containing protein [Pseudomonadota bacterium]